MEEVALVLAGRGSQSNLSWFDFKMVLYYLINALHIMVQLIHLYTTHTEQVIISKKKGKTLNLETVK